MDRGAWWAIVHGVAKSQTQLSKQHFHFLLMSSGDGDIFFNRSQSQIFPKSIYRVLTVLTKVLGAFLTEIGKHFKINIEIELSGQNTL